MKKKGALQLSINTIVLIVLAFALTGIIIGSFSGIFNQSRERLLTSLELVDASVKATSSDVMAGADALRIKRGQDQIISVSFYNNNHASCENYAQVIADCFDIDPDQEITRGSTYFASRVPVAIGQEKTLPALINIDRTFARRPYICTLRVRCDGSDIVADQHSVFDVR